LLHLQENLQQKFARKWWQHFAENRPAASNSLIFQYQIRIAEDGMTGLVRFITGREQQGNPLHLR